MATKSKRKKTKKAAKPAAPKTRRSTAGPGFAFEDQVAAWLILKVLTGQPLPGIDGTGTGLQMQTETLGWFLDDALLTAVAGPDDERHIAISCKSNVQVTSSGLPADFVERAWKQWFRSDAGPMKRGKDCLMLATRGRHSRFEAIWADLKNWAPGSDRDFAVAQMRATAKHRKIFDSVKVPAKAAEVTAADADVVALIARIEIAAFDFDLAASESEKAAIAQARSLLVNNSLAEGRRLWLELVTRARDTRLGTGTLDFGELRRALRTQFALKAFPDFESSWERLRAITLDERAAIESALPSGLIVERQGERAALAAKILSGLACILYGESGTGKSALVKTVLDTQSAQAGQMWFGPERLEQALSEANRTHLGLIHPLIELLDASTRPENFLIIDAAERLSAEGALKAKSLIAELIKRNGSSTAWRILVLGQTESWANGELQKLVGETSPLSFEVRTLSSGEVERVLRSTDGLGWLASHDDALAALANLRTLAWVIEAAVRFQDQGGSVSLTTIADRLWSYWTDDKATVQRLLMRLAGREASFEHSFAVSELDGNDAAAFDSRSVRCPLRLNPSTNRLQFQHDLAADWARFQRLKEIAADTGQWAALAGNPLWTNALRMLGQFLLRQAVGHRSEWDVAFEAAEQQRDQLPLARDILLDALFLDPSAETFLDARVEMLFAGNAGALIRLLKRFEHVASVPGVNLDALGRFRDLSLYIEAQFRTPIIGRWSAMARFLAKHRKRVAKLTSPAVASVCLRWLTGTPLTLGQERPTPFRREFAELALASARELQFGYAIHVIYIGDFEDRIYQAAFAGAPDLPPDVSEWALEMAQRRRYRADIVERVAAHRREQSELHARRLASDPEYRTRHERRMSAPTFIPSGRRLPPWPLGPQRRIEGHFRGAVLHSAALQGLMRVNPAVAAEVLLATIIEDSPEESHSSSRGLDRELGLAFDDEGYPTAYWKSPFFAFLQINADAAIAALRQLLSFCTDRWEHEVRRGGTEPSRVSLRLSDGTVRQYRGSYWVFTWSQLNSLHNGQLHCALAALERRLCSLIDHDIEVTPLLEGLLRNSDSVAFLGVLVNVGKHRPELFRGPLKPLLALHHAYVWDSHRVDENAYAFDAATWLRSGEVVFEMARDWVLAAYRQKKLRQIVSELITRDKWIAGFVRAAAQGWTAPDDEKGALELRLLVAELNDRNYTIAEGGQTVTFAYPAAVMEAVQGFQQGKQRAQQALAFPDQCRGFLNGLETLSAQQAAAVASLMVALDGDETVELDEEMQRPARVATAASLLLRGRQWLAGNAAIRQRAERIIQTALAEITDDAERSRFRFATAPSYLVFAAYFAAENWIASPSLENDEAVLRILTSGDDQAAGTIAWLTYRSRTALGPRWWRLLYLALLWSGLSILAPRAGDDEGLKPRWQKWCRWLRTRSLSDQTANIESIQPLAIAQRIERFEIRCWRERHARDGRAFEPEPGRRLSGGLETHFLQIAFAWLFNEQAGRATPAAELEERMLLVLRFWEHEAWCQSGSGDNADDDYKPLHPIGYEIAAELARLVAEAPVDRAAALWRPVLALGPKAHYAVGTFLTQWFNQISETTEIGAFASRWRPMIEYMIGNDSWATGRQWHYGQQLERQILGFGASDCLARSADHAALIGAMHDLYKAWAEKRLNRNEDNLAGLCGFLSSRPGTPLRIHGLLWIADALRTHADFGKWYRDGTSSVFMALLDVLMSHHATEISKSETARQALLDLSAHAASRQLPAALALQERVRKALRT
jgi:hypothetical protein